MSDLYNIALFVERGFEDSVISELEKIVDKKLNINYFKLRKMSILIINKVKFEDVIKLSYVSRVLHDSLILLGFDNMSKFNQILNNLEIPFEFSKIKIKLIKDNKKYGSNLSKQIYKKIRLFSKENNCELFFKGYIIDKKLVFGISLSKSIGKRGYKVFSHNNSINPVSISTFLNYIKIPEEDILVIYSKDGTIPIEIGIISKNIPANFWSKKDFYILDDLSYLIKLDELFIRKSKIKIYSVDNFSRNIVISKRNAVNAMVKDITFFKKANIKYLDLILEKKFSTILIDFYKEKNLNIKEILYSTKNLIKDDGKILIISDKDLTNSINFISKKLSLEVVDIKDSIFLNEIKRFYILRKNNF
ncbi:MAG: hypothetical protein QW038_02645 [Nanopusillaceae archaeon]